jgi:hypothetical protein
VVLLRSSVGLDDIDRENELVADAEDVSSSVRDSVYDAENDSESEAEYVAVCVID